jgi:hypothetical protein
VESANASWSRLVRTTATPSARPVGLATVRKRDGWSTGRGKHGHGRHLTGRVRHLPPAYGTDGWTVVTGACGGLKPVVNQSNDPK